MNRRAHHHDSSSMSGILAPEVRKAPIRDFHKENLQMMSAKESEVQRKMEEEVKQKTEPTPEWKMKRFASVGSKLNQSGARGSNDNAPYGDANQQPRKMTKAEAMKLRMQQERENGVGGSAANVHRPEPMGQNVNVSNGGGIQMENIQKQRQQPTSNLRESNLKPLPSRPPLRGGAPRATQQESVGGESIYNIKPEAPIVRVYAPEQTYVAPEPVKKPAPRREPVPRMNPGGARARASSVRNSSAQNAGRQILNSQNSQKQMPNGGVRKSAVPSSGETNQLNKREPKNFVKANMKKAIFDMQPPTASQKGEEVAGPNRNYGKVPSYLNKFKNQREDALKQQAIDEEMSKHPPGTRLMPEEERQATLNDLNEAKLETNKQLEKLPVVAHSAKMERHKAELEEKLARLDRAIDTFSKPTVYVAM